MSRLEDITVGASIKDIASSNVSVNVVAVKWHGNNAITVTYRNSNDSAGEQVLYRDDENELNVGQ